MPSSELLQAIESFHSWRRALLLPGHATGTHAPDPELVLSSKMLRVFVARHPEFNRHIVQLQLHFVEHDYTNRVKPLEWQRELTLVGQRD